MIRPINFFAYLSIGLTVKHRNFLFFCFIVMLLPMHSGIAQVGDDITGASDHSLFSRFPDSRIISYDTNSNENYQLVLGSLRRVAGQVVREEVERLRGRVTRITYEVSQSFTGANVIEFFEDQAQQLGYTQLFNCSGRECGSSSYWANTVFENRILNGLERNQFYMALETNDPSIDKAYLSVYVITRANRRLYAYIELVELGASVEREISSLDLQNLQESGSLIVQDLEFDSEDRLSVNFGIVELTRFLHENPNLRLYIVGHVGAAEGSASNAAVDQLLARSLNRANQVRDQIIEQGIAPNRLTAQGVGPLAPICAEENCVNRIEAVLQ